ncbi:hypothetical protein KP509_03G030900 [Ceratopteris richardii]|nr:hypothetical protein KP509_03G030900 [Ceratopteris richardii]
MASQGVILCSFLADHLVMTFVRCGAIDDAHRIYASVPHRTVFSCTALMSGYVDIGQTDRALKLYHNMQKDGIQPDSYTFVSLLKAFECIHDLEGGMHVHSYACEKGITSIPHVCNSLMGMYGKCGALAEAEQLFCHACRWNIVSWSIMLLIYCEQGQAAKALQCYRQMHEEGLKPDQFVYVFVLQACGIIADDAKLLSFRDHLISTLPLEIVQALHGDACQKGYISDVFVGTAFLTAYSRCGKLSEAEFIFNQLRDRNLVSWNALLSAYIGNGCEEMALRLYLLMQKEDVKPEQMTFVLAFQACGNLADKLLASMPFGNSSQTACLQILQSLHSDFCVLELFEDTVIATALLRSYSKCGAIAEAVEIFNTLLNRDLVSCNAMLTSYIEQGQAGKAISLYFEMKEHCMALDDATMITILLACSDVGNTEVCMLVHFGAVSTTIDDRLDVAATLIHTYGNFSMAIDSQACFEGIPKPDAPSWNACIIDHSGEKYLPPAFIIFENAKLAGIRADEVGFTSILAVCMHAGLVAEGLEYLNSMRADFGINPDCQHYSVLIDLFARAGDFKTIENVLEVVQVQGNKNIWVFLLGACRTHGNTKLAKQAFECALSLQPNEATAYVLMSNIHATLELQESF